MRKIYLSVALALFILSSSLAYPVDNLDEFMAAHGAKLAELAERLESRGLPDDWFWENFVRDGFRFHASMENYFTNMTEHRYDRGEIDLMDYKKHFGVERKIELGCSFIERHRDLLQQIEERNGIDYEIVVAILGMETNFAEQRQRGNFNVFDALVSQYLLVPRRENFAVNQLVGLHTFMEKTGHEIDYFVGSFAGASGWGQFIPTSLNSFFVSFDGDDTHIDIFSIEDNLASIENYLYQHGLNRSTMDSEKNRRNAVFAYNRNDAYVQAVLYIYEELKKRTCS